jgi:hypothetical protein
MGFRHIFKPQNVVCNFEKTNRMTKKIILLFLLIFNFCSYAQMKNFNTFTLINNGEGIDVKDNVKLNIEQNSLSLFSKNFTFKNAQKTGRNELYNDSVKGDIVATQYKTTYYEIVLMRYINYPNEVYLKIIDLNDNTNYLIHLHNK